MIDADYRAHELRVLAMKPGQHKKLEDMTRWSLQQTVNQQWWPTSRLGKSYQPRRNQMHLPEQLLNSMIEVAARTAHEANKAHCESLGDYTQVSWVEAPDWQQKSAIQGVWFVFDEPKVTPEGLHENWSQEKMSQGWAWGEVKDAEAKTHPCLVPYDELPDAQKAKDRLFNAVVRGVLNL